MKIRAVADTHGYLPEIEPCDLLLIGGDFTPTVDHSDDYQYYWLNSEFRTWLEGIPAKYVVGVAGNHDFIFESDSKVAEKLKLRWHYLQDSSTTIEGLKIYGSPWQPWFYSWAFNAFEPELEKKWELIPNDADILLLHGPPYGAGDQTRRGENVGSKSLLKAIRRIQPKLVIAGHIHEANGIRRRGDTVIANCSYVDHTYKPAYKIKEFEL